MIFSKFPPFARIQVSSRLVTAFITCRSPRGGIFKLYKSWWEVGDTLSIDSFSQCSTFALGLEKGHISLPQNPGQFWSGRFVLWHSVQWKSKPLAREKFLSSRYPITL